jgi:hypothetical protein
MLRCGPDDYLHLLRSGHDITPDLALKHTYDGPSEISQLLTHFFIASHVAPNLRYPEIGVAMISELLLHGGKAPLMPTMTMPHIAVNEYGHLGPQKYQIGFAW